MQDKEEYEEGKVIDVKATIEAFIEEEKPELSQEEAIKYYKDGDIIDYAKKRKKSSSDEEENEDDEHLKRVKKELLESLERVNLLEKKIFEEKGKDSLKNVKLKHSSDKSGGMSQTIQQKTENQEQKESLKSEERSRE